MRRRTDLLTLFLIFLRLGLTSFGGPVAHLGYFREEFVARRKWLDDAEYADIVALCQFLPGPASSQVGITIGIKQAGLPGAVAAWLGFTLPSAALMMALGYGVSVTGGQVQPAWLHGLKIVAVAVVALAILNMARTLCPDTPRRMLALGAALLALCVPSITGQMLALLLAGLICWRFFNHAPPPAVTPPVATAPRGPLAALAIFGLLLAALPLLAASGQPAWVLADRFFRTGALAFGGGHVVLPLLQSEIVRTGLVSDDSFLAGYGAAQALPGPLFTISAYLGVAAHGTLPKWLAGILCLLAIFLPSFLLIAGILPYWESLRRTPSVQAALQGINAGVVGLLLAVFYHPVFSGTIASPRDFIAASVAFGLLTWAKAPPWLVVLLGIGAGAFLV